MKLQGQERGRQGKLGIAVETFAVTRWLLLEQMKKDNGDTLEYNQICSKELRPALRDILCTSPTENSTPA